LAGLSGALYAHYITFISSASFSLTFSILVVVMVVVGGLRSLWGAVLGSLGITALQAYLAQREEYAALIYGILLILVFMYLPEGVVGEMKRLQRLVPFLRDR
jgi:branched-chain amino acid transport system permease protein